MTQALADAPDVHPDEISAQVVDDDVTCTGPSAACCSGTRPVRRRARCPASGTSTTSCGCTCSTTTATSGSRHTALGTTRSSSSSTAEFSRRHDPQLADHRRRDHRLPLLHKRRGALTPATVCLAGLHRSPRSTRDRPSAVPPPRRPASLTARARGERSPPGYAYCRGFVLMVLRAARSCARRHLGPRLAVGDTRVLPRLPLVALARRVVPMAGARSAAEVPMPARSGRRARGAGRAARGRAGRPQRRAGPAG